MLDTLRKASLALTHTHYRAALLFFVSVGRSVGFTHSFAQQASQPVTQSLLLFSPFTQTIAMSHDSGESTANSRCILDKQEPANVPPFSWVLLDVEVDPPPPQAKKRQRKQVTQKGKGTFF